MPELTNFTVTDTSNIGKLTMLTIDIPAHTDAGTADQGVFSRTNAHFQKELTISIDRLGLREVFSANIISKGTRGIASQTANTLHKRNGPNQGEFDLRGLSTNEKFNIQPFVYIDGDETKLIIVTSFATPYTAVPVNANRDVILTVIGSRR
tara:strand:- start:1239 stop:1691 length:453 start_codon:yes stop_codon:yes gene_type:complete